MPFWQELLGYAKQMVMLKEQTEKNTSDVKALREEVKALAGAVQSLSFELRFQQQGQADSQANLLLRLENQLLRFERRLPAPHEPNSAA